MTQEFIEDVYYTLQGLLIEKASVANVENMFEVGKPCYELYASMLDAYQRLCSRLGVSNEDPDVEIIINALMEIGNILAYKMFHYGAYFQASSDPVARSTM